MDLENHMVIDDLWYDVEHPKEPEEPPEDDCTYLDLYDLYDED